MQQPKSAPSHPWHDTLLYLFTLHNRQCLSTWRFCGGAWDPSPCHLIGLGFPAGGLRWRCPKEGRLVNPEGENKRVQQALAKGPGSNMNSPCCPHRHYRTCRLSFKALQGSIRGPKFTLGHPHWHCLGARSQTAGGCQDTHVDTSSVCESVRTHELKDTVVVHFRSAPASHACNSGGLSTQHIL